MRGFSFLFLGMFLFSGSLFGQGTVKTTVLDTQTNTMEENITTTNVSSLPTNESITLEFQETNTHPSPRSISNSLPSPQETYHHMLGAHYGGASGAGLCYKYYFSGPFALQFSFVPFYMSGENNSAVGFLIGGVFGQWFLHDFSHPLTSLEGRFFVWSGMKAGVYFGTPVSYYTYYETTTDYEFAGGGGIGFETYSIKNIVFTSAVGYFFQFTSQARFVNSYFPLTFEWTLGYRF
ncbi:MAG: hypothetical protein HPY78_08340 [Brevinematales bacterium]|nr:hypothetical protein [Brevinematales bacterium]